MTIICADFSRLIYEPLGLLFVVQLMNYIIP